MKEFDELFGGKVAIGQNALRIEDILAEPNTVDTDLYAASISRHQTPTSNIVPFDTETPDDTERMNSEDKDVVNRLASEQQKKVAALDKQKSSALVIQPIAPVSKKIKKTEGMYMARSIDALTREMRQQTSQEEEGVEKIEKNLPQTYIEKAFALVQESFGDDKDFLF